MYVCRPDVQTLPLGTASYLTTLQVRYLHNGLRTMVLVQFLASFVIIWINSKNVILVSRNARSLVLD
jgi:hypothetical protein